MTTEAAFPAPCLPDQTVSNRPSCRDEAGRLIVDLGAVAENWQRLGRIHTASRVGAVVKADAYGLGAERISPMLAAIGCREFFVAHLAEALVLKSLLPGSAALYVLNGLAPGSEALCAEARIIPVLNTLEQAFDWAATARELGRTLPAALQVDTGMSRLGLSATELDHLMTMPDYTGSVTHHLLMTHMACADAPDSPANARQIERFRHFSNRLPGVPCSIANSAATLSLPSAAGHVLRPGLALYGVAPGPGMGADLQPAVSLEARIIQIRRIEAGTGVGYGLDYVAPGPRRIATISAGYADGWPRALSGKGGAVWFRGHRLPLVGRVSMDSCAADVTDVADHLIRPGDAVELIGPNQSVADVAQLLATTPHEILTGLGRRFARTYLHEPPAGAEETPE
jgi:alanine racemase